MSSVPSCIASCQIRQLRGTKLIYYLAVLYGVDLDKLVRSSVAQAAEGLVQVKVQWMLKQNVFARGTSRVPAHATAAASCETLRLPRNRPNNKAGRFRFGMRERSESEHGMLVWTDNDTLLQRMCMAGTTGNSWHHNLSHVNHLRTVVMTLHTVTFPSAKCKDYVRSWCWCWCGVEAATTWVHPPYGLPHTITET